MKKNFSKATAHAVATFVTLFAALFTMTACNEFPAGEEAIPQPAKQVPGPTVYLPGDTVYQDHYIYLPGDTIIREIEKEVKVYKDYRLETVNGFGFATATITNPSGQVVKTLGVTYLNKVVTLGNTAELGKTTFTGQSGTTFSFAPNQEAYASEEGVNWSKDDSESLDEHNSSITGSFSKTITVETDNGTLDIPVVMRPGYLQVVPRTVTVTNTITNNVYNTYYVTRESHLGWGKVTVTDSIGNKVHEWTVRYSKTQVMVPAAQLGTTTLTSANASPWSWNPGAQTATATHSGQGYVGNDTWTKDTFNKADDEICIVEGTFKSSVTLTTEAGVLEIPLELNATYLQHTEAVTPTNVEVDAKVINGEGFAKLTFTQEGGKKMSEFNLVLDSILIHRASVAELTVVDLIREANMVSEFTAKQRGVGSSEGDSIVYQSCKFSRREFGETTSTAKTEGYVTTTTYTNKVTLFYNVAGYIQHRDGSKEQFTHELAPWYTQVAVVVTDETPTNVEVTGKVTNGEGWSKLTFTQKGGVKMSEFNLKLDSVLIHRASVADLTVVNLLSEANMIATFTAKQRSVGTSEGDSVVYQSCKFSHREFGETTSSKVVNGYVTTTTYKNKVTLFYKVSGYILHRDGSKEQFTFELAPWYSQIATVVEDNTPDVEEYTVTVDVTRIDECTEKATIEVTGTKGYYAKSTARYSMAFPSPKSDFIVASLTPVDVIDSTWTVTDGFNPVNMWQKASYTKYIKHDVQFVNAAGARVGPGTTISGWGTEIRTTLPTGEAFRLWCEFDANVNDSYAAESGVADWTLSDGRVAKYGTTMTQHTTGYTEYRYQIGDKEYVAKEKSLLGEGTISMKIYVCTQK